MIRERILSALVLIPIVLLALYAGGWWWFALITLALLIATYELVAMLRRANYRPTLLFAWLLLLTFLLNAQLPSLPLTETISLTLILSLIYHNHRRDIRSATEDWLLPLGGALYLGGLGRNFLTLRAHPDGLAWIAFGLATTWILDSCAYFVGINWGRHRLAPYLSPKKSWEGAVGGFLGGLLCGLLGGWLLPQLGWIPTLTPLHGLILGGLLGILTPFGDLGISMIKRQVGVKDTGHLIPGHGGILDRIDTLIISITIFQLYITYLL